MEYKKIVLPPYNLHIMRTDKFKTVSVEVYFKRKIEKEEITIRNFLSRMLNETTKEYNTRRAFTIAKQDLYDLSIYGEVLRLGNSSFLSYKLNMLNEKYTEKGMHEKCFSLFSQMLFNPNINNNKFDSKSFFNVKEKIATSIKLQKENAFKYSIIHMLENMEKDSPSSYNMYGYLNDLDNITEESLYEYYQSVLNSDRVDVFIIGDISIDEAKKLVKKYINIKTIKKPMKTSLLESSTIRKRAKKITEEEKSYKQSQLVLGFNLEKLTDFERRYVITIYNTILGNGPDSRLFNNVREKHSLAYTVYSGIQLSDNIMYIYAGINEEDYDKALKLIRKEVLEIQKGNIDINDIEKAINAYINSVRNMEDSSSDTVFNCFLQQVINSDNFEEKIKKINKVKKEDIIKLSKKIKLNTIFLMRGGNMDETN